MSVEPARLGVIAFGDSITNGGGGLQWGVAMKSWAEWVARGLGVPFTGCAVDGALIEHVTSVQIPEFELRARSAEGRFELGCLYVGVNDVRTGTWDAQRFGDRLGVAVDWLRSRCDRVILATAPLDLGRPRAGVAVVELNATIERTAADGADVRADPAGMILYSTTYWGRLRGDAGYAWRSLRQWAASRLPHGG